MTRYNPFDAIYDKINLTESVDKLRHLPVFPIIVDVELTNLCNFKCLMCPVGTKAQQRQPGFMADTLFSKLLEEAALHRTPLRFILWGEPTMHKKWLVYLIATKKRGLPVHFNSNGSLITDEQMEQLVAHQIDSVKFSFQGVDRKSYREMRNCDFFPTLIDRVAALHRIRGENPFPFIHVSTTITYESRAQVEKFQRKLEKITDKITVGRTELERFDVSKGTLSKQEMATIDKLKSQEKLVKKHPNCCPEVFDKLSVHWDGVVSACCRDFNDVMAVGNLEEQTLAEIWCSKKLQYYRQQLAEKKYEKFELCRNCFDYHGLQTPGLQNV